MAQRGRIRNAGVIDTFGETVPYPIAPMWVAGRFYAGCHHAQSLGTVSLGTTAYLTPIIVPRPVTATSIGIEVTGAGGAGSLARLAIYTDRDGAPHELVLDAGTVAVDGAAYQSAAISQVLQAGIYWLGLANKTVTSAATVRAFQPNTSHSVSRATLLDLPSVGTMYIALSNNPATGGIVDVGWMHYIQFADSNVVSAHTTNAPRIMLGV